MINHRNRRKSSNLGFLDLTTNLALMFMLLFILVAVESKNTEQQRAPKLMTEFIITMTWDNSKDDDVDLIIRDPTNTVLYFKRKDASTMSLERDDRGIETDNIGSINGREIRDTENREIATIRKSIPGIYTINALMYRKNSSGPTTVHFTITKVSPFQEVLNQNFELEADSQQITAINITIDENGNVEDTNQIFEPIELDL